eukprot:6200125-Pleurochrysis_carterae.AAC.2
MFARAFVSQGAWLARSLAPARACLRLAHTHKHVSTQAELRSRCATKFGSCIAQTELLAVICKIRL